MQPDTADAATDALEALVAVLDAVCEAHGLDGVPAAQAKFIAAIHLLATVSQRAGLSKGYVAARVAEMLPRAMDASEADEHEDMHRGGDPS